jgi:hypothetical protein
VDERRWDGPDVPPEQWVAFLEWFVAGVDRGDAEDAHPLMRAQAEATREIAALALLQAQGQATAEDRDEFARRLHSGPIWARRFSLLNGLVWLITVENRGRWQAAGEVGQIWIRWDTLDADGRKAAISLATFLHHLGGGRRRPGRPTGSRLTSQETAAIRSLGAEIGRLTARQGYTAMVRLGAWAPDGRPDASRRAQRARAARWRRLRARSGG